MEIHGDPNVYISLFSQWLFHRSSTPPEQPNPLRVLSPSEQSSLCKRPTTALHHAPLHLFMPPSYVPSTMYASGELLLKSELR